MNEKMTESCLPSWSFFSFVLKHLHIILVPEVTSLLPRCWSSSIPIFPLLSLLLVYLLYLRIFVCKFQRFYFVFLAFFDIFWVIGHDLQLLWHFEFLARIYLCWLLLFLTRIPHRSQSMQSDNLLSPILLILDLIPFLHNFFNNTGIKLSISRKDSLTMSSFIEQLRIRFLKDFKQISWQFCYLVITITLDFSSLFFNINFKNNWILPFPILLNKTFG